jgi:hypothetical protein
MNARHGSFKEATQLHLRKADEESLIESVTGKQGAKGKEGQEAVLASRTLC